jgi:hypothetical protein
MTSPPGRVVGNKLLRTKPHAANPGRAAFLPERNRLLRLPLLNWHTSYLHDSPRLDGTNKHYNNVTQTYIFLTFYS